MIFTSLNTELDYNKSMKSIKFQTLLKLLKNNNFDLFYKSNSKSRSFKDKSNIIIDSNSIRYKHGTITEKDTNSIYLFDNQFIAFHDYKNYRIIEINLLSSN